MRLRTLLCWILLLGLAEPAMAQSLPSLRVDPTLLGGTVVKKEPKEESKAAAQKKEAAPAQKPEAPPAPAPVVQEVPPGKPVVLDAPRKIDAEARAAQVVAPPVAEAAESPRPPSAETTRTSGNATLPALRVNPALLAAPSSVSQTPPVAASRVPQPARAASVDATRTAGKATLPALRVNPALLGLPTLLSSTEPPQVADQPALPPLYSAYVAADRLPQPLLRPSDKMVPLSPDRNIPYPTFIAADRMSGKTDVEMIAEGDVELRKIGTAVNADRLTYWPVDDEVEAVGNVRLERDQETITGPRMKMRIEESTGFFEQPTYSITRMMALKGLPGKSKGALRYTPDSTLAAPSEIRAAITGQGQAERMDFEGEGLYRFKNATYSTCSPGNPDWYAEVGNLGLDYNREVAEGNDAKLVFMGVPLIYSPWMSFSLNNQRKSGFLTPTFGTTTRSGFEFTLPWYWNIAPNMDATITPRFMSRRGTQWNTEARYLNHTYNGQMRFEYLPFDRLENKRRSGYSIVHNHHNLGHGFSGSINLNGVSDDNYFSDLSSRVASTAQVNLLRQGVLNYGSTWWNANATVQRWQTLQGPAYAPYAYLPQFNMNAARHDLPLGLVFNFAGQYTSFDHPSPDRLTAKRTVFYPQLSWPLQTAAFSVKPKIGVHVTHYDLERQAADTPSKIRRQVPIFSVDSNVVFERDFDPWGRTLTQTLEPRLYYLYVQKRDQSVLNNSTKPVNFDSGLTDFNFSQIFSENRYGGSDRIGDANQLTAALTSRLIDPSTGAELLRGALGQRFYFSDQEVTLPNETRRSNRKTDLLAALYGVVAPKTYIDTGWQYNPHEKETERLNFGVRYQPETARVLNAGYRYTRQYLGQIDVSGQWPLRGGWHGVGRVNYSMKESRMIETVAGLEYNAGCWIARFVVQRIATQIDKPNTAFFAQLELNGFSRIGSNPLEILTRNIPGYGLINQPTADPIFGAN